MAETPNTGNVTTASTAAQSAAPNTTAHTSSGAPPTYTSSTTINSIAELKDKAPQVYNAMMEGIAMTVVTDMKHHQDKLKQLMDEGRRQDQG